MARHSHRLGYLVTIKPATWPQINIRNPTRLHKVRFTERKAQPSAFPGARR